MCKTIRLSLLLLLIIINSSFARTLLVASEMAGEYSQGGLGWVIEALFSNLNDVDLVMPGYTEIKDRGVNTGGWIVVRDGKNHDVRFQVYLKNILGRRIFFLVNDNFFQNTPVKGKKAYTGAEPGSLREGYIFAMWNKAVARFLLKHAKQYSEVSLHDWHTGFVLYFLRHYPEFQGNADLRNLRFLFTIHNGAYQGVFPAELVSLAGLMPEHFNIEGFEFYGKVNFMKAMLSSHPDFVQAVSATYAQELTTSDYGSGLEGIFQRLFLERRLGGILNGFNYSAWNPERVGLPFAFKAGDFSRFRRRFSLSRATGKDHGKAKLQGDFGFDVSPKIPLFVCTSRLDHQKGFTWMLPAVEKALSVGKAAQFIFLNRDNGAEVFDMRLKELERRYPKRLKFLPYSLELEKLLTAYGDFILLLSLFEPAGLNDLFAMAMGTIPVVAKVGGFLEKIHPDTSIAVNIRPPSRIGTRDNFEDAYEGILRALEISKNRRRLYAMRYAAMKRAMTFDWSIRIQDYNLLFTLLRLRVPQVINGSVPVHFGMRPTVQRLLDDYRAVTSECGFAFLP